jgi:hypothetical protein
MAEAPEGLFKMPAVGSREAEVCVTDGIIQGQRLLRQPPEGSEAEGRLIAPP